MTKQRYGVIWYYATHSTKLFQVMPIERECYLIKHLDSQQYACNCDSQIYFSEIINGKN